MLQRKDLTIDEAVKDPMIRLVMKADRIDPRAFEAMLRSLAAAQAPGSKATPRFPEEPGSGRGRRLPGLAKAFNEACVSW